MNEMNNLKSACIYRVCMYINVQGFIMPILMEMNINASDLFP